MSKDFGPYGKGIDGYVHYTQAIDEAKKGGGKGPSPKGGCLTNIISIFIALALVLVCFL
ncbi:MAG: hypothetical protein GX025_06985 [Clostridiales bacterium]|nr:hypothetical protein [Clostridiales bacterium]